MRWNRYGRFLGCAAYPECRHTQSMDDEERPEPEPTGDACPKCGSDLVRKTGRFGPFIACSGYPACKHTQPVAIPGMRCPKCGEGEVGEKRTRRGKVFWGCARYPACDWSSWDRPIALPCPACEAPFLIEKSTRSRGTFYRCTTCRSEMAPENVKAEAAAHSGGKDRSG